MTTPAVSPDPQPTEAQLQRVDAVLVAFFQARSLPDKDLWKLKHRVRVALTGRMPEVRKDGGSNG